MTSVLLHEPVRTILLDIEGTTTPLDFVHNVLFPYARSHVRQFLDQHISSESVRSDMTALQQENVADARAGLSPPALCNDPPQSSLGPLVEYIAWLIDRDRKSPPLKSLQGKIWEDGYKSGELRSPVFVDVPRAFERWQKQKKNIAIFSSGSVLAQRLLFAHTVSGDLTSYISGYFDTATGSKTEAHSYQTIARTLQRMPSKILFISDVTAELDAATAAGFQVLLCQRPGNNPPPASAYRRISDFDDVFP